jgi:hypothetical protein
MSLFQRRRGKGGGDGRLGLIAPERCINSEEMMLNMEMNRTVDGILGTFVTFDEGDGKISNRLMPRSDEKMNKRNDGESDFQQFIRLAGLDHVPDMQEVEAIRSAALERLAEKYAPLIQAARAKGPDGS